MMVSTSTSTQIFQDAGASLRVAKAQKFINDKTPYTLNEHGLVPEDVSALWKSDRELAKRIINRAHSIFTAYRTNAFPIFDKLDPSTPAWEQYCQIIRLGANITAAQGKYAKARELLVYASVKKIICPLDEQLGNKYLLGAAHVGRPYAQYLLGTLAENPRFSAEERARMKKGLACAAKKSKLPLAIYLLGKRKLPTNPEMGVTLIHSAAEKGLAEAEHELGLLYFHGTYIEKDLNTAAIYLLRARQQGYIPAYNNLACLYLFGIGVDQSLSRATTLFKISADAGSRAGCYNLGFCYAMGWGIPESLQVGWDYYEKSLTLPHNPSDLILSHFNNTTFAELPELSGG